MIKYNIFTVRESVKSVPSVFKPIQKFWGLLLRKKRSQEKNSSAIKRCFTCAYAAANTVWNGEIVYVCDTKK